MSGLLVRRTAATLLIFFILLSGVPLPHGAASDGDVGVHSLEAVRYRPVTEDDLVSMMSEVGVWDPLVNYNVMVGGMGTGLAPPTAEEWELSLRQAVLDLGADEYEVPLASSLDLSSEPCFPQVRSQGSEGSCAAFSLTYYNYGYIEARDQGWTGAKNGTNSQLISPSWTYNKVNGDGHEGSSFQENARIIKQLGAATWDAYPYLASDDEGLGDEAAWRSAPSHRISSYVNVYNPSSTTVVDLVKEQLGLHRPISFAMDANEYTPAFADGNKIMSSLEYVHAQYNHGQTIVGYDDALTDDGDVGAFKVVNSWGMSWGQSGYYYITYQAFKEMLGYPLMYLMDIEDYQPSLLATWTFSQAPSVDAAVEVGAGSATAPTDKVSTYFTTGNINIMSAFMAIDASSLYNEYMSGEDSYYLKVGAGSAGGTVSSFRLELYSNGYVPGSPTGVIAQSVEVPKSVPGTVNATLQTVDSIPPISEVLDAPAYQNVTQFVLHCASSDPGGSGVDHLELYYRFNSTSYVRYAPSSNPSGEWTGDDIIFNISEASGQGPYHFYSVAVDGSGNREAAPSMADASTTVDLTAPITTLTKEGELGENGWYVSTVSVTMSASDQWSGADSITYRSNGGEWTSYSSPLILAQGTYALEFCATDRAGNREAVRSALIDVDTGSPSVSVEVNATSVNGWYRSAVSVSLMGDDMMDPDCSVRYRLDGGDWVVYQDSLAIDAEGEHVLECYATDDAGNSGTIATMEVNIDTTVPLCAHSLQGDLGEEGRYTTEVNVTLTSSDDGSGVDAVMYRLDGAEWRSYTGAITIDDDGYHVLEFYAVDLAGNQGPVSQVEMVIDSHGPSVALSCDPSPSNGWSNEVVTVTLTSHDLFDQDCPAFYRLNGGEWQTYVSSFSIDEEGWHVLEYYAVDLAGNQGVVGARGIGLDLSAPDCVATLQGTTGLNGCYVSQVSVSLSSTDDGSGIEAAYYRLNGGTWISYQGAFILSMEGANALELYAVDQAGNIAPVQTLSVNIDTIGPTIIAATEAEALFDWFNSSVLVWLTPGASDSGCPIHYRLNGGPWALYANGVTISNEGTNLLEWYGTDEAGNQGQTVSEEFLLDLSAPECSVTLNGTEGSNGYFVSAVGVIMAASDQGSGMERTMYRLDGGEWAECPSEMAIAEEGNHTLELYGQDRAGSYGEVLITMISIDTSSPEVIILVLDAPREDHTYLNDATVRLAAQDDVSGVASISFSLDGSAWQTVDGDILVEGEGLHEVRYTAMDLAGNNATVTEISFEITMPTEAPGAVQGLTATINKDSIYLQWSPSSTGLESRYLVYRTVEGNEELIANLTGTEYLDTYVRTGVDYDYIVVPLNVVGEGPSASVSGLRLPDVASPAPYLFIGVASLVTIGVAVFLWRRR